MSKEHAFGFIGRFQPPTAGHGSAASEVKELADSVGADHFIFGTHSEGDRKNPLPPDLKLKHMKVVLNTPNVFIDPKVRKPPDLLQRLHDMGYKKITLVAGGSRAEEYEKFRKYIGKKTVSSRTGEVLDLSNIHPDNFKIHKIERDHDSDTGGTEIESHMIDPKTGKMKLAFVSGSRVRAAVHGPLEHLASMMPSHMTAKQIQELQRDLQKHMGLYEEVSAITRIKLAKAARRTASRRKLVRRSRAKRRRNLTQLKVRAKNEIISRLRQKVAGKRNWKKVPYSQRVMIDRHIAKRRPLVNNMIKRIMPEVVRGESERLKNLNNSFHPIITNFLSEATKGNKVKRQPVDSSQKAKRKRQNTTNQRNSRAKHNEAKKSGDIRGRVYVVKNKKGEVEIVDKKSLRKDHQIVVDSKNASIGEIQKYLKDKSFSNTKTSIELFGYQQDAGGEKKPKKKKKEEKSEKKKTKKSASSGIEAPPQMIPAGKKASKKDTYASSHDATSMETGIAFSVNAALGLKPEEMVKRGLIDSEDVKAVMSNPNESFMPSCQRAAQQLMKQFPGAFIKHTGRMRKTTKLSQDAIDNGVRDNTPKSDLVLVDKDGNVIAGFSQKIGDSQLSSGGPAETVTNLKFAMSTVGDKMQPSTKKEIEKFIKFFKNELAGNPRTRQGPVDLYKTGGEREGEDKEVRRREELHEKATDMLNKVLSGDKKFAAAFIYALVTGAGKFKEGDPAIATHIMSANRDGTDLKVTEVNLKYAEKLIDKVKFQMKFKSSAVETTDVKKKWQEFKQRKKKLGQKIKLSEDFRAYSFRSVIRAFLKESFNILSGSHLVNVLLETSMSLKDATPQEPQSEEEAIQYLEDAFEYIGDDYFKLYQFFEDVISPDVTEPVVDWPSLAESESSTTNLIYVNGRKFEIPVEVPVNYSEGGGTEYPLLEEYLEEKKKRNYRQEYDRYHARPEQRKNRSKRVLARRLMMKLGRVRKGDGKDVDHKDGNPKNNGKHNLRVRDKSENRADND